MSSVLSPAEILSLQKAVPPRHGRKIPPEYKCNLREIRKNLRLSLEQVSKEIGYSIGYMSQIELGECCSMTCAIKIAEFYHLTLANIWSRKEPFAQGTNL